MKKNVKYLGMAAAALLAVAPVVTTGVVNAADQINVTPGENHEVPGTITTSLSIDNANSLVSNTAASSLKGTLTATLKANDGSTSNVNVQLVNGGKLQVFDWSDNVTGTTAVSTLKAGHTYVAKATGVSFTGLKPNTDYTYNGETVRSDGYGNLFANGSNTVTSEPFTLGNSAVQGTPYFVVNGEVATTATLQNASTDVVTLSGQIQSLATPVGGSEQNRPLDGETAQDAIEAALKNAGVKVTDGHFTAPAGNVVIPWTVRFTNGKTATINITAQFNGTPSAANAPAFYNKNNERVSGTVTYPDSIELNSNFNVNTIKNAYTATINPTSSTKVNVAVASNNVNTSVPGTYQVVLTATNPEGKTSQLTVNVTVGKKGEVNRTVKYVPGYYVYAWNINGNRASISSTRYADGSTVTTEGDAITVAGVKYYKLADSNLYIQAQYVDGSYKPENKPSNSKEEAVSGVLTVKYDGKGKVALMDGNGKYTGQFLDKNTKWKVYAKKTINGQECYRLGSDKQWIPAKFSELAD